MKLELFPSKRHQVRIHVIHTYGQPEFTTVGKCCCGRTTNDSKAITDQQLGFEFEEKSLSADSKKTEKIFSHRFSVYLVWSFSLEKCGKKQLLSGKFSSSIFSIL